jgi:hypothetical protein
MSYQGDSTVVDDDVGVRLEQADDLFGGGDPPLLA